jgi:anaerobic ribonucleoside-triphosphate reductase
MLQTSYDDAFVSLLSDMQNYFGEELFTIDGIGEQLDINKFATQFFNSDTSTADTSVDSNSNVSEKNSIVFDKEFSKPIQRLNSYYLLWKELKRLYGQSEADAIIRNQLTGVFYINDFSNIGLPYCFNYTTYDIALLGLPMVNKIISKPPKYFFSFKSQVEQFIVIASNSTLGATGIADFLLVSAYYVDRIYRTGNDGSFKIPESEVKNYIKDQLTSFIYTVNQPNRGNQSAFTNISLYDDVFLDKLCDDYKFPDGRTPKKETVKWLQELFLDIMNEELERTPVTFPVTTACMSVKDGEILDKDFLKLISKKDEKFGFVNIYMGATSTLSSCCFSGKQKVLTKSSNGVFYSTFSELDKATYEEAKRNFSIFHNGSWVKGKVIKIPKNNKKLFKITTQNNKTLVVTEDHINPTLRGDIRTDDLTSEDYLLFNQNTLNSYPEKDKKLSYQQGVFIGAYLGDGSIYDKDRNELIFSINQEKLNRLKPFLDSIDSSYHVYTTNTGVSLRYYSKDLINFVREYVKGTTCNEKELLLDCLCQSVEFRQGILDGFYITDGGNSNRLYTTSQKLAETIEVLLTSLGKVSIIDTTDRTDEKVIIRGKEFTRNFPTICVRWYEPRNKRTMKDVYKILNNSIYFKIKDIEEIVYTDAEVYCFEMNNPEEPYFTLPNGVITHNCRLRSDMTQLNFNTIGGSSSKIGSVGVVTLNLPRIAYGTNSKVFLEFVKKYAEQACKINNAKRQIISKRIELNAMPLYSLGFMSLDSQFSTVGFTGMYEAVKYLEDLETQTEYVNIASEILRVIDDVTKTYAALTGYPHNIEQTPSETSAIKLVEKDKYFSLPVTVPFYSNQFLPLQQQADLLDRIYVQGQLDRKCSGGSILHINIDNPITAEEAEQLTIMCAEAGVVYYAKNYVLNKCKSGHMTAGTREKCWCGKEITDRYTRVVG